jgi:hypothetical protein
MALTTRQAGLGLGVVVALAVVSGVGWFGYRGSQSQQSAKAIPIATRTEPITLALSTSPESPSSMLLEQRPLAGVAPPEFRSLETAPRPASPDLPAQTPPPPPAPPKAAVNASPKPPSIDASRLRRVMDQGVAAYASSKSHEGQTKGAALVYLSAIGGYRPARDLVAHNYPISGAVRTVVPAEDAIRFAVAGFASQGTPREDTIRIFRALAQHYADNNALSEFSQLLLEAMRDDRRLHFNPAIDAILAVLDRVPGSCSALANALAGTLPAAKNDGTCSTPLIEALIEYLTRSRPGSRDTELRSRALELLAEMDTRP